jgi:ribulose-phosphate 3-epimerase
MKVAPSILSGNFLNLEKDLEMVNEYADLIHVDVMDGSFVPNISFGFPIVEAIEKVIKVPMDVHLMIVNPDKYVERFAKAGADMISFHLEAAEAEGKDPRKIIELIHAQGVNAGLVINPDIPVEKLFPYIEDVDFFLIMSVFAGFGGQKFIEASLGKIESLRKKMDSMGVNKDIEVDGGVEPENIEAIRKAGATICVAGTAIFAAKDRKKVIEELRGN